MEASHLITRYVQALGREVHLRPGTTDEQVFHETFVKQFHVPPEEIRPATVLDLGCNIGLTVAHFEVLWPNAEIIGVDLDSENCVVARRNLPAGSDSQPRRFRDLGQADVLRRRSVGFSPRPFGRSGR